MTRPLTIFISHPSDLLTDSRPHGDGLIADQTIRQLALRGHRLHVAVSRFELKEPYSSNVTLHQVDTGSAADGPSARLRFAIGTRMAIRRILRREPIDLIHQLNPVVTGLSLFLWKLPLPIVLGPYVPAWPEMRDGVISTRPPMVTRLKRRVKREIWQLQHRIANAIILSTPAAMEKMDDPSALQSKIHVIPYGIDTAQFSTSTLPSSPAIVFAGHLAPHKGIFVLLDAFRIVTEALPDCRLILAGVAPDEDAIRRICGSFPDPSRVELLGHVPHAELPAVMRRGTVFCVPSFGEPFGLVAVEAMACGRAIVGTDSGGLVHLITEEGGRRVPVGDATKLAHRLIEILSDPLLARRMGEHNRSFAEREFDWPAVIGKIESAYGAAIAAHG